MKVIIVILLVFGVASAVPLKAPIKNLQDLLTQQNFNKVLQPIQKKDFSSIQSILDNFDVESMFEQFFQDMDGLIQQFIQPFAVDIFVLVFSQPVELEIPMSIITSFYEDMENAVELIEFTEDTSDLQQFLGIAYLALEWISAHPDDVQVLLNFANNYIPADEFISSVIYAFVSNFATLIIPNLGSLNQQFVQEFVENFDFQEYLTSDIVFEILSYCFTNLDDAAIPISFLTSLGINYFYVIGQIFAGTFNPEQFINPEIAAAAFNWAVVHPNEVQPLANFFMDYLPIDQITSSLVNALLNILPSLITNIVPTFSPQLLPIFG